jgi:hypothetical protein
MRKKIKITNKFFKKIEDFCLGLACVGVILLVVGLSIVATHPEVAYATKLTGMLCFSVIGIKTIFVILMTGYRAVTKLCKKSTPQST